jgi:TonB family protein
MKNLLFVVFVLSFFCLHAQNYTSLEEALKNAEDAKELDLRNQELEIVPSEVFQLKNLKKLKLNGNPILKLPDEICLLEELEYLDINQTQITSLPLCMNELPYLKMIYASPGSGLKVSTDIEQKVARMDRENIPPLTKEEVLKEYEASQKAHSDEEIQEVIGPPDENDEPSPNDFIRVSEAPKPLNLQKIVNKMGYPEEARKQKIEGQVIVRVMLDEEGNYQKHLILREGHPLLAKAVEEHISMIKFSPAIQDNKPVQFWMNIPFNFRL